MIETVISLNPSFFCNALIQKWSISQNPQNMAYLFLTHKERELYQSVPQKIEEDILWKNFFPSKEDKIFIHFFHGNQSKVAVALQVGIIRLLGFLPEGWNGQINPDWIGFITEQLKIAVNPNLLDYGAVITIWA